MVENLQSIFPYFVLLSHVLFVILLLAFLFRESYGKEIIRFIRKYSVTLAFIVALLAVNGSLFYSNIVGFPPCVLCWWQRIFLFPQLVIFAVAVRKNRLSAFMYSLPLSIFGALIALYQSFSNQFGGSILPCTAVGGECSKIYVSAFGYITIPVMSLTVFLYLILLAMISRTNEESR